MTVSIIDKFVEQPGPFYSWIDFLLLDTLTYM
jgi:hypothetical protein